MFPVLVALRQRRENIPFHQAGCSTLLDRATGRPGRKLELHAQDGRLLGDSEAEVRPRLAARRGRRDCA
jgi:hypothetical protein